MDYIDINLKNVEEESKKLYKIIKKEYDYDLVIFIAKGAYIIGENFAKFNNTPLLEIFATRKGGKLKKIIRPLLLIIPNKILIKIRKKEVDSPYHAKNSDRQISFDKAKYEKFKDKKKVLLIDDSVDTGNSIILTKKELESFFVNSEIKVATYNVMNKSTYEPDFYLYRNTIIRGPWSSDSKENKKYVKMYYKWKEGK